jgi:hypothetical protein
VPNEEQALSAATPPEPAAKKEEEESGTTPTDSGVVKANKGMILRKSVDYIRYLQQLVTAQASRNRELEGQLERYRSQDPDAVGKDSGEGADDMGLVLHEDVDGFAMVGAPHGRFGHGYHGSEFGLASVSEMDVEDGEEVRPGTAMTGMSALDVTSPSVGSGGSPHSLEDGEEGSLEDGDEGEEEERGRRGRDGKPRTAAEDVKVKEEVLS